MSSTSAPGGASALYGAGLIILSAARSRSRSCVVAMFGLLADDGGSEIGILEDRVATLVEGADPLAAVGMDGGAPVGRHHDRDRLLDRLSLAHADGALDRLDRGRRVARDLRRDPVRCRHQL